MLRSIRIKMCEWQSFSNFSPKINYFFVYIHQIAYGVSPIYALRRCAIYCLSLMHYCPCNANVFASYCRHLVTLPPPVTAKHQVEMFKSAPLLKVPFRQKSFGKRSFNTAAPSVWNSLPTSVLNCDSLTLFKARLKTHLLFCFWLDLSATAYAAIAPRRSLYKSCINPFTADPVEALHFTILV